MDIIDLGIGDPETARLPLAELREAALHRLSLADKSFLQYTVPEQGSAAFRAALAAFLSRHYGCPVNAEHLLVTAGASHGLGLVLKHFVKPGDTILVEDPTYHLALDIIRDYDVRVVPVPVDERGLDVEALERCLDKHQARLLYTIPIWHNPTGTTLPLARRQRLLELAREHDLIIAADEVYQMLGDADHTPPPLSTFGRDRVLSLGSFSKILAPGLRLGWVECAPRHVATLARDGVLISGGAMNPLTTAIAQSALELGIQERYLLKMRKLYARRRRCMVQQLRALMPGRVRFTEPHGGFFIWLKLPEDVDVGATIEEARDAGLLLKPGAVFSPASEPACGPEIDPKIGSRTACAFALHVTLRNESDGDVRG